ncbi:caspase family protein [Afipia sp. GAS231]|uniref:caspase family protein n=1 Tax=Afipia sp. GAS231 TaxID=1882747 RepID=UPI0008794062|nr:caspase family protein [Afipia sp. GAS231]SDN62838.1 Caspase domain-containing protein [Afipia sp. GAS231]
MVRLNFCLAGILSLLALGWIAPASAADRVALVIGNGAYQKVPTLPNPPRDAADIGSALERLNFKVTRLNNAGAAEMRKAIVDFGRATEGAEMAIVFYAGHGMEAGGENWLIPTDAELRSDTDVESEAVSLRSINLQVSKARQLGLVILDACRNNPFAAKMQRSLRTRAVARGLAPTEPTDNVLVAYAARDGTTANDGDGRNSPFTTALLRNIETPGLEISFLFRNVRDEVMTATKREQQPFVYGSLSKEAIYLKAPVVARPPAAAPPATVLAAPPVVVATTSTEQNAGKDRTTPPDEKKRNAFTEEDAKRIAAMGSKLKLSMPPFAIGETKADVPVSFQRYVGIWVGKVGPGEGRQKMLVLTEALSDGMVLGHYVYGPAAKGTWDEKSPAGYVGFAAKISDNAFRFWSGIYAIEVKFTGTDAMSMRVTNPDKKITGPAIRFTPLWRLVSADRTLPANDAKGGNEGGRTARKRTTASSSSSTESEPASPDAGGSSQSTKALYAKCSAEGHRIAGGPHKNVGFSRIEACVRNGGQM